MLFAYEDSGMEGMASDGILGLSNDISIQNFLDIAKKQGIIEVNYIK